MYVHIGGEYTILVSSVIAMVNLETVQPSSLDMKSFLKNQEEENIEKKSLDSREVSTVLLVYVLLYYIFSYVFSYE